MSRYLQVATRTSAQRSVADRGGMVFTITFYLVVTVVLSGLWRAAAEAGGGSVAGYSALALTWYIATSEAATVSLNVRLIEEIGDDIASGTVAVELLRPASVLWLRVAGTVGRGLPRLGIVVVAGIVLSGLTAGAPPNTGAALLALPALVLAITANLVAQHAFASASFWVRDARSTWFLYQKLVFLLGGMLLPLEILPGWLETIARALPFMAMAYAPARLAAGYFEPELMLIQLGWLVVLGVAAAAAFSAGERRLQVVGG